MSFAVMRPLLIAVPAYSLCYPARPTAARKQPGHPDRCRPKALMTPPGERGKLISPILLKLQVLLDRAHASPGQIDATPRRKLAQGSCGVPRDAALGAR